MTVLSFTVGGPRDVRTFDRSRAISRALYLGHSKEHASITPTLGGPQWGKAEIGRRGADTRETEEMLEELRERDPGGDVKL